MIAKNDAHTPTAVLPQIRPATTLEDVRALLVEQRAVLARQAAMIEALDRRREELEELLEVMLPIGNAAVRLGIARMDALEKAGITAAAGEAVRSVRAALDAPAPSLWQLWRKLRAPDSRRGLSALLEVIRIAGTDRNGEHGRMQ